MKRVATVVVLRPLQHGVVAHIDPLPERLAEHSRRLFVLLAEQAVIARENRRRNADAGEEVRQLRRDESTPYEDDRRGHRFEAEDLVARQIGHAEIEPTRPGAGADHDAVRRDPLTVDLDGSIVDEAAVPAEQIV